LLLLLRKDCLFCHRSECYGPPSPSISLESIKSLKVFYKGDNANLCALRVFAVYSGQSSDRRKLRPYLRAGGHRPLVSDPDRFGTQ